MFFFSGPDGWSDCNATTSYYVFVTEFTTQHARRVDSSPPTDGMVVFHFLDVCCITRRTLARSICGTGGQLVVAKLRNDGCSCGYCVWHTCESHVFASVLLSCFFFAMDCRRWCGFFGLNIHVHEGITLDLRCGQEESDASGGGLFAISHDVFLCLHESRR